MKKKVLEIKNFKDITDEELKQIMSVMYNGEITQIERCDEEITVTVLTDGWKFSEEDESFAIEDEFVLSVDSIESSTLALDNDDYLKYKKLLISMGYNSLFEENEFM